MKLFSALGLVVVFMLLAVMMPRIYHDVESTLHQFISVLQDLLVLAKHAVATISLP